VHRKSNGLAKSRKINLNPWCSIWENGFIKDNISGDIDATGRPIEALVALMHRTIA
jgi:hypothetical protein